MSENVNHKLVVCGDIHLQNKEHKKSKRQSFISQQWKETCD